jgi:hypothetical protein
LSTSSKSPSSPVRSNAKASSEASCEPESGVRIKRAGELERHERGLPGPEWAPSRDHRSSAYRSRFQAVEPPNLWNAGDSPSLKSNRIHCCWHPRPPNDCNSANQPHSDTERRALSYASRGGLPLAHESFSSGGEDRLAPLVGLVERLRGEVTGLHRVDNRIVGTPFGRDSTAGATECRLHGRKKPARDPQGFNGNKPRDLHQPHRRHLEE